MCVRVICKRVTHNDSDDVLDDGGAGSRDEQHAVGLQHAARGVECTDHHWHHCYEGGGRW